jgi:hypothetical protein
MKHEIRDDDIKLFGRCESEHIAILEINPIRKAKDARVLFCPLEAGLFRLECLNVSMPVIRAFLRNSALTQLKNPRPQPTSRILNSSSLPNGRKAKASVNMAFMTARAFLEAADVGWW